jgi:predicted nucleotidyltransferase
MTKKNRFKNSKKIINHYINLLKKEIKVKGVLLFGSFAWGKPTKHSDVDLIIISPDFNKKKFSNRLQWLSRMRDDLTHQIAMDIIGYTPKEFAN